jgi:mannan polymerase II complex MNN11 subunit
VPALRHALKLYPTADYLWSLSPHALITNPSLSLLTHILSNITNIMQKDVPVVPPDSVIHTFPIPAANAHLIMSQDMDNIAHTSFLLRTISPVSTDTDAGFAHFLLDSWFDPLYRAYAFHLAELHALEHIIQWHVSITMRFALIPQRMLNSYNFATAPRKMMSQDGHAIVDSAGNEQVREHDSMWAEGDLVVNFKGCDDVRAIGQGRDCEGEMGGYYKRWEKEVLRLDGILPTPQRKAEEKT